MIRILKQIFRTGIVTEDVLGQGDAQINVIGDRLEDVIKKRFRRSITIRQVDAGSCNGCELEIHALNNSIYNFEQYGINFTASPRFSDMLLVTGPVTRNMETALRRTYNATPPPKLVVAVGTAVITAGYSERVMPRSAALLRLSRLTLTFTAAHPHRQHY